MDEFLKKEFQGIYTNINIACTIEKDVMAIATDLKTFQRITLLINEHNAVYLKEGNQYELVREGRVQYESI